MILKEWDKLADLARKEGQLTSTEVKDNIVTKTYVYQDWLLACEDDKPLYLVSLSSNEQEKIYREDCVCIVMSKPNLSTMTSAELTQLVNDAKSILDQRREEAKSEATKVFMTAWTNLKVGFPEVELVISTHRNGHPEAKPAKQITIEVCGATKI